MARSDPRRVRGLMDAGLFIGALLNGDPHTLKRGRWLSRHAKVL